MGCGSSSSEKQTSNQNVGAGENFPYQDILTNNEFKKFQDMQETTKDRYVGQGIMKFHNYKCPLPIDKLESLREQFWLTRNQADKNWKILKSCMGLDETEAQKILDENGIVCVQNNIQNTYNKLQPSYIYHLPNFVISDPIYEREYANYEEIYDSIEDNIINVKLYYITQGLTYDVKIRNNHINKCYEGNGKLDIMKYNEEQRLKIYRNYPNKKIIELKLCPICGKLDIMGN